MLCEITHIKRGYLHNFSKFSQVFHTRSHRIATKQVLSTHVSKCTDN